MPSPSILQVALDPNPPFLVYPGAVTASGQSIIPGITGPNYRVQAYAVKNATLEQIKNWYKDEFTKAGWSVQKHPGFAGDNDFIFQKGDSKDNWLWLQVMSREDWDYVAMHEKRNLAPDETGFRLFWHLTPWVE